MITALFFCTVYFNHPQSNICAFGYTTRSLEACQAIVSQQYPAPEVKHEAGELVWTRTAVCKVKRLQDVN